MQSKPDAAPDCTKLAANAALFRDRGIGVSGLFYGTPGWELDSRIGDVIEELPHYKVQKYTFGSTTLPLLMKHEHGDGLNGI